MRARERESDGSAASVAKATTVGAPSMRASASAAAAGSSLRATSSAIGAISDASCSSGASGSASRRGAHASRHRRERVGGVGARPAALGDRSERRAGAQHLGEQLQARLIAGRQRASAGRRARARAASSACSSRWRSGSERHAASPARPARRAAGRQLHAEATAAARAAAVATSARTIRRRGRRGASRSSGGTSTGSSGPSERRARRAKPGGGAAPVGRWELLRIRRAARLRAASRFVERGERVVEATLVRGHRQDATTSARAGSSSAGSPARDSNDLARRRRHRARCPRRPACDPAGRPPAREPGAAAPRRPPPPPRRARKGAAARRAAPRGRSAACLLGRTRRRLQARPRQRRASPRARCT